MNKINLTDSVSDIIVKMSSGNHGALKVILRILKPYIMVIDPHNLMGGVGYLNTLDSLGIYGTDLYVLMNDICENDVVKFVTLMRGYQLGFISGNMLIDVSSRQDRSGVGMIDIDDLYKKVKIELGEFGYLEINSTVADV